eukprot:scaffold5725_cov387-Prasinococcus_capsulatus_cf.AAC.1
MRGAGIRSLPARPPPSAGCCCGARSGAPPQAQPIARIASAVTLDLPLATGPPRGAARLLGRPVAISVQIPSGPPPPPPSSCARPRAFACAPPPACGARPGGRADGGEWWRAPRSAAA